MAIFKPMMDSESDSLEATRRHLADSVSFPLIFVGLLWLVHVYQYLTDFDPGAYGIMSRRLWGLQGIFSAPFMHGSWGHLFSNTVPLLVLTTMLFYFYRKVALRAFWMIYFLTGISVWLFARPVSHIGASGVVYGLVSFIFWNGIFRRSVRAIMLAGIVVLLYSGMFLGILPEQEGISWESHLLGSIMGIAAAFWFKNELEEDEAHSEADPFADERGVEKTFFLPRDIFDKTKAQRAAEAAAEAERREAERQAMAQRRFYPPFWDFTGTWNRED